MAPQPDASLGTDQAGSLAPWEPPPAARCWLENPARRGSTGDGLSPPFLGSREVKPYFVVVKRGLERNPHFTKELPVILLGVVIALRSWKKETT